MADNKQSFQAGQAAGRTEEKTKGMLENVKDAAASAQVSAQQVGQNITKTAVSAVDVVKEKTGMNKK